MGIAFAAELLILAIIFCCTCIHLGKVHKKCTGKNEGMGHPSEEMCRAVAVKNGVGNFASLGIALMLYLWVQNIHATFAIIYGAILCVGCILFMYSVLCYEVRHQGKCCYRKLGALLCLVSIFATALTGLIALF